MTKGVFPTESDIDDREEVRELLANLHASLPALKTLLLESNSHWTYEDGVYRFYHQSFKVYGLQARTKEIVKALQALAPDRKLNKWFLRIVKEGTGKKFQDDHNKRWLKETRPILEAYFHAKYFLEMAVLYGGKLKKPPLLLPSGWAGLLYLYELR
jgi:hypothetical protein